MNRLSRVAAFLLAVPGPLLLAFASGTAAAQSARGLEARSAHVIDYWTPARRAVATPRDLVIDERGLGYLRAPGQQLIPYGHDIAAKAAPGGKDSTGPAITAMTPAA